MAEAPPNKPRIQPRNLLGVLAFLLKYRGSVALCIALLLVNISIEMSLPQILGEAITQLRRNQDLGVALEIWPFVWLFGALVLVRGAVGFLLGPIRNRLVQRTLADIRAAIYDALQRLAFQFHDKSSSGELISRSTTDVGRLQDFFFACLLLSVDIVIALAVTLVLIFNIRPSLGWLTVATTAPTIVLLIWYAGKLQPRWREVHDLQAAMTTVIQENIAGMRVVKAFAREPQQIDRFIERRAAFLERVLQTVNYWGARVPFAQFLFGLSVPLVLWVGGRSVIAGDLLIGDLVKVIFYLMAISHRVGMVGQFTNIVQNASASAERVLEIIREPQTLKPGRHPLPAGRGRVRFEHVSFHYSEGKSSLRDVSFEVEPGRTYAVMGPTGSGKSTLVNLIPRFYDPSEGRILVEGVDVRELDLQQLRRAVSVIFQETFLFSATVAENIAFGRPEATQAEIERCARAAQAHEFILQLERGYETVLGERGVTLSGGQKQRIAIARAFLTDPRILILDDATSSVDPGTERRIQEAFHELARGRTTFVIAHRFSTVQHADAILVLKDGHLVEQGTHDELTRRNGFYAQIVEQQMLR